MASNPRKAKRQQQIRIFNAFIEFCAIFARSPKLQPISNFLLRRLADLTFSLRKGQRQNDLAGLAKEWQRMSPAGRSCRSSKSHPKQHTPKSMAFAPSPPAETSTPVTA